MKPPTSALFFPETEPSIHDIGKLLFFFNSLSYYLPTESNDEGDNDQNLFKDLCTGYVPAPLHEDLSRFNRLLHEMENSRPGDLARLFSSAKSPIATGQIRDKDEASAGSILSALQQDNSKKTHTQRKELLWQARLILKLAEMLDRKENEIRRGLTRISSNEQKNFASLKGNNETQPKNKVEYPEEYSMGTSTLLIPLKAKAWAELFLAAPFSNHPITIVTTSPDSGSILLDGYENAWRKTPQKLFSLSIPTFPNLDSSESAYGQYISSRNKLHLAAKDDLKYFESVLMETAVLQESSASKYPELNIHAEHIATWEEKIELEFPSPAAGYQKLEFYCFPGISSAALFQKIFNLEPTIAANEQRYATGILAILHA